MQDTVKDKFEELLKMAEPEQLSWLKHNLRAE